jgi:DNA-binding NarL/FixJ family response regulator
MENAKATPPSPSDGITADSVSGPRFTVRQREVLDLLCKGLADKTISRRMKISLGTVKTHVAGVLRKLGVSSRLQAVVSTRARHDLDDGCTETPRRLRTSDALA